MAKNDVEIYKAQTLAVESLLDHHPEFDPATNAGFSEHERSVFTDVFQPDWDKFGDDYHQVFEHLLTKEPRKLEEAQTVLQKFFRAHGVDPTDLELSL
ncbi:MAG: hypothetical protein AAB774_02605 [Patescibacteria group bacterium]